MSMMLPVGQFFGWGGKILEKRHFYVENALLTKANLKTIYIFISFGGNILVCAGNTILVSEIAIIFSVITNYNKQRIYAGQRISEERYPGK